VLPALIALWAYWISSGQLTTARGVLDQLSAMVREPAFASFEPEVLGCTGYHDFKRGHLTAAQERLQRALAAITARPRGQWVSPLWPLPNDPVSGGAAALAAVSAARGELDEAERWQREALRRAEEIGPPRGPYSLAHVEATFGTWIRHFLGDDEGARRLGAEAVAIGEEHGYALWTAFGAAWAATGTPGGAPDREFLERSLAALDVMGQRGFAAGHLARLARLDAAAGELDRAEEHLAAAVETARRTGEELELPEVLRQRAEVTLARGEDAAPAVADLTEAVRIATAQGARVSRLRAALGLARLPAPSRPAHWRRLLAEARADMPPSFRGDEAAAADDLLRG
jgi:tetratricopeptide (TPR) repeat protein